MSITDKCVGDVGGGIFRPRFDHFSGPNWRLQALLSVVFILVDPRSIFASYYGTQ